MAARPVDRYLGGLLVLGEAEGEGALGAREIAAAGLDHLRLCARGGLDLDDGADGVAIGARAFERDAQSVVAGGEIVAIEIAGAAVGGGEDVEVAVVVVVAKGNATADLWARERCADLGGDVGEALAGGFAQEKMGHLGVADAAADVADGVVDVAVHHHEVGPAVEIEIAEQATKAQTIARGDTEAEGHGAIDEARAIPLIEAEHFVIEVGDGDGGAAAAAEIDDVDAHAGAGLAVLREGDAEADGGLGECVVAVVAVELVGLGVVGDEEVEPAVVVEVDDGGAEGFGGRIEEAAGGGGVFKGAVAAIAEEPTGGALVGFRRAVGLVAAVERTVDVVGGRPADVVGDEEIEVAVAIGVEPEGRRGEAGVVGEA